MPSPTSIARLCVSALAFASPLAAQDSQLVNGGNGEGWLTPRTAFAFVGAPARPVRPDSMRPDSMRLRAVVLFRGQAGWKHSYGDSASRAAGQARWATASRESTRARRMGGGSITAGGVVLWVETDYERRRLWAEGQSFDLPERDSALVVLVDRIDRAGGPPIIAGTTYVPSEVSSRLWARVWRSGDTTYHVGPPDQGAAILGSLLRSSPFVRAFLE